MNVYRIRNYTVLKCKGKISKVGWYTEVKITISKMGLLIFNLLFQAIIS